MRVVSICVFLFACSLPPPAVRAQGVIYKCVRATGAVAYQNSPCPAGAVVRMAKPYADIPYDPALAEKVRSDRAALDHRKWQSYGYSGGYSGSAVSYKVQRCRDARARRKATLDAWGLASTYDLRQRLDSEVWEACKDAPGA